MKVDWILIRPFAFAVMLLLTTVHPARAFYEPNQQRWLNRDPSGERGGINLYQSFFNSPLNVVDRNGQDNYWHQFNAQDFLQVENMPPAMTVSYSPNGGQIGIQYQGGIGDPFLLMGGAMATGAIGGAGAGVGVAATYGLPFDQSVLLLAFLSQPLWDNAHKGCPNGTANQPLTGMLGENGTQTISTPVWKGGPKGHIDVENPAPGKRPGQIHYQEPGPNGDKWLYDPETESFPNAPKWVNNLLNDPEFKNGILKGMRYLGEVE